jgi:hypothetical protein
MRRLVLAFALLNAGLIALAWDAVAQQLPPASKGQLVGTWTLGRWWNIAGRRPRHGLHDQLALIAN